MIIAAAAVVALVAVMAAVAGSLGAVTVYEYERGLLFRRGQLTKVLEAGRYRFLRPLAEIRKIDVRAVQLAVNAQEVLSGDGVAVKASVSATYRVTDPGRAVLGTENYAQALYVELQQALRAAVSGTDIESLLANRSELGPRIREQCAPAAERLGLALESVAIRDLTLPGDLKKIFAQVVRARQEGLAALERARGETAALRNLANAAHLIDRNPHLMQLRLLQVLGEQGGNTIVVGVPGGTTPLPVRGEPVTRPRLPEQPPPAEE
jgi:regulator of protease activity HflC (stomatin/prohibitin superfamily)